MKNLLLFLTPEEVCHHRALYYPLIRVNTANNEIMVSWKYHDENYVLKTVTFNGKKI
jgi:hypothetical protein